MPFLLLIVIVLASPARRGASPVSISFTLLLVKYSGVALLRALWCIDIVYVLKAASPGSL